MTPSFTKLKLNVNEFENSELWIKWKLTISHVTSLEGERFNKPAYAHYFRWYLTLHTDAQAHTPLTQSHPNVVMANALSLRLEEEFHKQLGDRVMTPWFKTTSIRCMWQTVLINTDSEWSGASSLHHVKLLHTNEIKFTNTRDPDLYTVLIEMNGVCNKDATDLKYEEWSKREAGEGYSDRLPVL